tara:strand:- start:1099 stop:1296 length:198 start_codon:yes stop_codon:yes gene_type:complete
LKIPVFLQKEKDIEKLKRALLVFYHTFPDNFDEVVTIIKEQDNIKTLEEIKELRARADMLEEGLK